MYEGSNFFTSLPTSVIVHLLIGVILVDMKWYLTVVWPCISLMTKDMEHLFLYLLPICVSSLRRCLFRCFTRFLIGLFALFCWVAGVLYIRWILDPSLVAQLVKEYSCNVGDLGSVPGLGRSTGEEIGYPLQYSWASLVAQLVRNLPAMQENWVGKIPWRIKWQPTPVFLPGNFHGQRSMMIYSPWC